MKKKRIKKRIKTTEPSMWDICDKIIDAIDREGLYRYGVMYRSNACILYLGAEVDILVLYVIDVANAAWIVNALKIIGSDGYTLQYKLRAPALPTGTFVLREASAASDFGVLTLSADKLERLPFEPIDENEIVLIDHAGHSAPAMAVPIQPHQRRII